MATVPPLRLPRNPETAFDRDLVRSLDDALGSVVQQVNAAAQGRFSAMSATSATAPTIPGQTGDFIENSSKEVLGTSGSQYIVLGWRYVEDAWREITELTDG